MTDRPIRRGPGGRRVTDNTGLRAKIVFFWHVWGRDFWLIGISAVAVWSAVTGTLASDNAEEATKKAARAATVAAGANKGLADTAKKAATQAQQACRRSQKLSPPFIKLLEDAARRGVITEDEIQLYRDIVPKRC